MLTRLAPTPSGFLHEGNIFNFLLNWLWSRCNGGKVLLRIDDGDTGRKRKEYVEDIFRVLDWLGLDWDTGPSGPDDFEKNWSQLLRRDLYENVLKELTDKNMLFACHCSRKDVCSCIDKKLSLADPAITLKIKAATKLITFKDFIAGELTISVSPFVVRRKDGFASYQLSSVADDRFFKVTHICRGKDLAQSTAMQLYLDNQLQHPYLSQCSFWHHPLLTTPEGSKYSKSAGKLSRSIIHETNRSRLLHSFAQWAGIDIQAPVTLNNLFGSDLFKLT